MRSILRYAATDSPLESRIAAACDLARATGGHGRALMATPFLEPLSVEACGGVAICPPADGRRAEGGHPPTAVCRYLARHGIEAELTERPAMDRTPDEVIPLLLAH